MKKHTILILAACLAAQVLEAAPVTPGRALEIGKMILSSGQAKRGSGDVSIVWDGEFTATRATESPAFYVIARDGGGFVIISGDDNVRPVLAISEEGRFETEDMPENVRWWMERMKAYVRSVFVQTPVVRRQWEAFTQTRANETASVPNDEVTGKVEHLTPEWDQGNNDPYFFGQNIFNAFCPSDEGGLCVTGCVATSLAEVLTTLSTLYPSAQMPVRSTGTVGGYAVPPDYVAPNAFRLGEYDYDWVHLKDLKSWREILTAVNKGETDLLENLGHLLADCGAIVEAMYTSQGTSANSLAIPRSMAEHFFTSKTAHPEFASDYAAEAWISMLKEEIALRPVLYSGQDPSHGGHAFVLDGYGSYQESDVFHVNFGWMGSCNGYYYITNLDTGQNGNYSGNCVAIFDFYPDAGQETSYPNDIRLTAVDDPTYGHLYGMTAIGTVVPDEPVSLRVDALFQNAGSEDFSGSLLLTVTDKSGSWLRGYYLDYPPQSIASGEGRTIRKQYNGLTAADFNFDEFGFGYKVSLLYHDGFSWIPVSYPKDGTVVGELSLTSGAFIKTDASYSSGDFFVFELINHNGLYAGTQWTITDPNGSSTTLSQSAGQYQFTQSGKYKIVAAIAPAEGEEVVENVVTYITVAP